MAHDIYVGKNAYNVRFKGASFGTDMLADSEEEVLRKHQAFFSVCTPPRNFEGRSAVLHVKTEKFFCDACHCAPCKFTAQQ